MNVFKLNPLAGEHVEMTASKAIELARKLNRPVRFHFNGVRLTVCKRHSVKHVVNTWFHASDAMVERVRRTPAWKEVERQKEVERDYCQTIYDQLLRDPPQSKEASMIWLAEFIHASDCRGVARKPGLAYEILRLLGFKQNEHSGDHDLLEDRAQKSKRVEYIAGQAMEFLAVHGMIHPMLGDWARKESVAV